MLIINTHQNALLFSFHNTLLHKIIKNGNNLYSFNQHYIWLLQNLLVFKQHSFLTVYIRSSDPLYMVTYYKKWVLEQSVCELLHSVFLWRFINRWFKKKNIALFYTKKIWAFECVCFIINFKNEKTALVTVQIYATQIHLKERIYSMSKK